MKLHSQVVFFLFSLLVAACLAATIEDYHHDRLFGFVDNSHHQPPTADCMVALGRNNCVRSSVRVLALLALNAVLIGLAAFSFHFAVALLKASHIVAGCFLSIVAVLSPIVIISANLDLIHHWQRIGDRA